MMYTYVHGGDVYTASGKNNLNDYSANINPLGLPQSVKKAIIKSIAGCVDYPDPFCRRLTEKLANFLAVPKEYIYFSNGAADVLFKLALALLPKKALLLAPTFADYEKALRSVDCRIDYYMLREANNFEPQQDILQKLTPELDFVVICNPNNPTGKLIDKELLVKIIAKCRELNIKILIDECFMDFVADGKAYSMISLLPENKHLIILKAFTKTYAMPGLRLGYCLTADADMLWRLHECGQDWSVSVPAQEAGVAALDETEYVRKAKALITKERRYLTGALNKAGAKTYGSEANYIFFKLENPHDLKESLAQKGFLIRSCANYHNLQGSYYRIAVKRHADNKRFIKALKEVQNNALINGDN